MYCNFAAVRPLSLDDKAAIFYGAMGQAENKNWHQECTVRLTASVFKQVLRCWKPDGTVKDIPRQVSTKVMRYGINREDNAVQAYEQIMARRDRSMTCVYTQQHVRPHYPFIATSPDRIWYLKVVTQAFWKLSLLQMTEFLGSKQLL